MKNYKIRITLLAETDLQNASDYIVYKLNNPQAVRNLVRDIKCQIDSLVSFPERNVLDEDDMLAEIGVRKECFKNYKIYYIVQEDTIHIVRILHMLEDERIHLYHTFGLNI